MSTKFKITRCPGELQRRLKILSFYLIVAREEIFASFEYHIDQQSKFQTVGHLQFFPRLRQKLLQRPEPTKIQCENTVIGLQ